MVELWLGWGFDNNLFWVHIFDLRSCSSMQHDGLRGEVGVPQTITEGGGIQKVPKKDYVIIL